MVVVVGFIAYAYPDCNSFGYRGCHGGNGDGEMSKRGVNKVILVGACGKDPETKMLGSGGMMCNVSLATSEDWKDKTTGQKQERTEWHRVCFFGKLAEIVDAYVKKGSKIYVEGSLRTRSWEQDGVTRYATEIVANEMQLLDSRNGGPAEAQREDPRQQENQSAPQNDGWDNFDDDINF